MKVLPAYFAWMPLLCSLIATPALAVSQARLEARISKASSDLADRPTVYVRCQLRYAMDCESLKDAFFDKLTVLERKDDDSAMIRVLLTDERTPEGTLVRSRWSSSAELSVVDFALPDLLLPSQYDNAKKFSALSTLLSQGILLHVRVKSGSGLEDIIVGSLNDPSTVPTEGTSPFYVEFSASGSAGKSGLGAKNADGSAGPASSSTNGYGSVLVNRSTERTRLFAYGYANYSQRTQPNSTGGSYSADNLSRGLSVAGVYSLNKAKRWNVAIVGDTNADPGSNIEHQNSVYTGLEYNLVPFRIDQPYEFRVRAGVEQNFDRLVMPNGRGNTREEYAAVSLRLYTYWLFLKDRASLTGKLSGTKNVTHDGYYSTNASLSFSFQIKRGIRMNAGGSYNYLAKSMTFPGSPDFSNPLQTNFLSGYSGGGFSTDFGFSFTLGKGGTLYTRDRRFQ